MYLLFAAEPYEVISFKVPNAEVDKSDGKLFTHWWVVSGSVWTAVHTLVVGGQRGSAAGVECAVQQVQGPWQQAPLVAALSSPPSAPSFASH